MIQTTKEFRGLLRAARRAGTPILTVRTADPSSAIAQVRSAVAEQPAMIAWDLMTGARGLNKAGIELVASRFGESTALGPADMLAAGQKFDREDAIIFLLNAQRFWEQTDVLQGIWNLRDKFKSTVRA
jgi:hypothetical protein